MCILNNRGTTVLASLIVIAAEFGPVGQPLAQTRSVSILIVRHGESDPSEPTQPLTAAGKRRADLLVQTLRGIKFAHIFASHNIRARQRWRQ
jgi:hypothetical protein